jgi:transposase
MTSEKMNTDSLSRFLVQVSETHEQDFMVMVLDGTSSHKCKELKVPGNSTLVFLSPYSPELNPAELLCQRSI